MNRIEMQVRRARRRIFLGTFGRALCVAVFVALIVATIACAIPGIHVMDVDTQQWNMAWIVGTIAVAVVMSLAYAIATRPTIERVALEVDKRFVLGERLSSSLSMSQVDRESEFGLAVISDADRRADRLKIAERFPFQPSRLGWLPIAIAPVLAVVLILVEPASLDQQAAAEIDPEIAAQVKRASLQLKKRIAQQKRKADAKGLKDAHDLFDKLERDLDKLSERKKHRSERSHDRAQRLEKATRRSSRATWIQRSASKGDVSNAILAGRSRCRSCKVDRER